MFCISFLLVRFPLKLPTKEEEKENKLILFVFSKLLRLMRFFENLDSVKIVQIV